MGTENNRIKACEWWEEIGYAERQYFAAEYYDRLPSGLTGSEIEKIWENEANEGKIFTYEQVKDLCTVSFYAGYNNGSVPHDQTHGILKEWIENNL